MELNNSISILYNFASAGSVFQQKDTHASEHANERASFRKVSFHGPSSYASHMDNMARRIEKISSALTGLQQSLPELNDASTVFIARAQEGSASFSYSFTQDASGATFEEFTFQVQFKLAGDRGFTEIGATPVPAASEPASTIPAADPVIETTGAGAESVDPAAETLAPPQSFEERVAELIAYYRISTPGASQSSEAAATESDEAGHDDHGAVEGDDHFGDIIDIDANRVRRVYTGAGDDTVYIDADKVARVRTGEGDDAVFIDADKVRRINTGAGDDVLNLDADKVSRIRSGAGDDTVNIEADKVRRINTGAGDDVLDISADKITRINTGEGDDVLSLNADKITRVNTGDGDDTLNLTADTIGRVNAGAGDDIINLDAEDAAIAFGKGGGEDTINVTSVGALAIQIDGALAASSDEMTVVEEGDSLVLEFASGERLTINNVSNADMISVNIGGENVDLHLSEPPVELDMSA